MEKKKVTCGRWEWKRVKNLFAMFGWWVSDEDVIKKGVKAILNLEREPIFSPVENDVKSLIWLEKFFMIIFYIRKFIGFILSLSLPLAIVLGLFATIINEFDFAQGILIVEIVSCIAIPVFIFWLLLRFIENKMKKKAEELCIENGLM